MTSKTQIYIVSMSQISSELAAQQQLNAYNERNIDAFMEWFSSDLEVISLSDSSLLFRSIDDYRCRYETVFRESANLHAEVVHRLIITGSQSGTYSTSSTQLSIGHQTAIPCIDIHTHTHSHSHIY